MEVKSSHHSLRDTLLDQYWELKLNPQIYADFFSELNEFQIKIIGSEIACMINDVSHQAIVDESFLCLPEIGLNINFDEIGSCIFGLEKVKELYKGDEIFFANGGDRDKENIPEMSVEGVAGPNPSVPSLSPFPSTPKACSVRMASPNSAIFEVAADHASKEQLVHQLDPSSVEVLALNTASDIFTLVLFV